MKQRLLFIGETATLAHVVRPYYLASQLDTDIFEIHFATGNAYRNLLNNQHLIYHNLNSRSPKEFQAILARKGILFDEQIAEKYVAEEIDLIRSLKPDLIIGDLRPTLSVSSTVCNTPLITLTNIYWSPYKTNLSFPAPTLPLPYLLRDSKVFSSSILNCWSYFFNLLAPKIMQEQGTGINLVRKKYGLAPFEDYLTGFTWGNYTLYCDPPSLCGTNQLPDNHLFIGHIPWSPPQELPSWYNHLPRNKKTIFISLGSSGDPTIFADIVDSLNSMEFTVIVATAGSIDHTRLPPHWFVEDYLDGERFASLADIVITNGGSPSSYQAIKQGTPVLGIPENMDQLLSMELIAKSGAGICLRKDLLTVNNFTKNINFILTNASYRRHAKKLALELNSIKATETFLNIVNTLINPDFKKAGNI
jgi:UDP:flavonoid glycosyltransferase YjiC (YdhE family)